MDDEDDIDITGIDQAELLVGLYHGTRAIGLGVLNDEPSFGVGDARVVLASTPVGRDGMRHLDWVCGRPIKVGFSATTLVGAWLYDRDAGKGRARGIVEALRAVDGALEHR